MEHAVQTLCGLSIFCGIILNLTPEGKEKRVLSFVCAVVLLAAMFRTVKEPDWELYALEAAQLREREEVFLESTSQLTDQLQRTLIEAECGTYIQNKARQLQINLNEVSVTAQWSMEGIWVPHSAVLTGEAGEEERSRLSAILEAELGIPRSRQEWRADGS